MGVVGDEFPVAGDDIALASPAIRVLAASIAATTFSPTMETISAWPSAPPQAIRTSRNSMTFCASTASRQAA
jgi:hypothetical protein